MTKFKMFIAYLFLSIFLMLSINGCGKSDVIEGIVQDDKGFPLEGVKVTITKSRFTAETDSKGIYNIEYAPGPITLEFSKKGYFTETLDLVIHEKSHFPAKEIQLRAYSQESPEKLAKSILLTYINNDQSSFEVLAIPKKEIIVNFLENNMKEHNKETAEHMYNNYDQKQHDILDSWIKVNEKAKQAGVDWKKINPTIVEFDVGNSEGIEYTMLDVFFLSNNRSYRIHSDSCINVQGKWHFMSKISFSRLSPSNSK